MPRSTGWRTDADLYPTASAPFYDGVAVVGAASEAAVRAGSVAADLAASGQLGSLASFDDPSGSQYSYGQGFVVYDFDPLINPADPTVTYEPQVPFGDTDTARSDWLGNVLGDPTAGVIFEDPQGALATDQPIEITDLGFTISGINATLPPVDLHFWLVDDTAVYHDGIGWHAISVPFDAVLAAAGAAPHHLVGPYTSFGFFSEWLIDLNHEVFSFADLRTDNSIAFALSLDPSTDAYDTGATYRIEAGLAGPINAQVRYRNPRYRLLFADLPLRQYPRDDALGGTPRQDHSSRSVQGSQRQGWIAAYR